MSTREIGSKAHGNSQGSVAECKTAARLLDAFGQAVQEVLILQEEQFVAIKHGDTEANRFDLMIHEALERKQNAKYAYLNHLGEHHCSER